MNCLEKDPSKRPASAQELAVRLDECQLDREWTADRARRWWETHRPETMEEPSQEAMPV